MSKITVKCAFCKGTGKDPFDLLSNFASCQVCGGRGKVEVMEPAIPCAFCKATGVYPHTRITCTVCNGKGMVTVRLKAQLKNVSTAKARALKRRAVCLALNAEAKGLFKRNEIGYFKRSLS